MFKCIKNLFSSPGANITTTELENTLKNEKITLLDVRTPQEYHGGHIKEAHNIPLQTIHTYEGNKEQPIYVICHSGMRSRRAASILNKKGYNAINVKGGMMSYKGKTI